MKYAMPILLVNGIPRATMSARKVMFSKVSKLVCARLAPASNENILYFDIEKL